MLALPPLLIIASVLEYTLYSIISFGGAVFGELILPLAACIFAASVFLCRNPMHALLSLLGVFFSTVLMYLTAGIAFVGLVFLIVYVGAVAVLFLFVIMLLNVKSLTSADQLIRHLSQIIAIIATIVLIYQLYFNVVISLDILLVSDLLRDTLVEPTTGEAVLRYVRYEATDINALTGLYTVHAILFLVTTSILLAALLGAIILATVTTERATSISDIRAYSNSLTKSTTMLSAALVVGSPELDLTFIIEVLNTEVGPVFMSLQDVRKPKREGEYLTNQNRN